MTIREIIEQDLKQAMMNKETDSVSALRMLVSSIKDKEISIRTGGDGQLTEEQVLDVVKAEIKKRTESISAYEQGQRDDLVIQEKKAMAVIEKYMPAQMSDEELETIIKDAIAQAGPEAKANFGKLMGSIMPLVKGKADGNRVTQTVKKLLE